MMWFARIVAATLSFSAASLSVGVVSVRAAPAEEPAELTEANFVAFAPIIMSVVQERRIMGLVEVVVTLKLADAGDWREIVDQRARIKDRLVHGIAGMTRGAISVDTPMNIDLVTAVLQRQVNGVLGANRAQVLIVDASTRAQ